MYKPSQKQASHFVGTKPTMENQDHNDRQNKILEIHEVLLKSNPE